MPRRPLNRLTHREVQTIAKPGRHADGAGLYLHVDPSGAKRWVYVYQWLGARREVGLGSALDVKIAKARELAQDARKHVQGGVNPMEARKVVAAPEAPRVPTFGEVADAYIKAKAPEWRSKNHRDQWAMTMAVYAEPLRGMPVDAITVDDVLGVLRPIWPKIPDSAKRIRGRIEIVLGVAKARKLRTGENPAAWKENLEHLLPRNPTLVKGHFAAMPFDEVPAFMSRLRAVDFVSYRALQLIILTAVRTNEALGARWEEFDLRANVWTIPKGRMKGNVEHRVPLTPGVLDLIGEKGEGLLFPSPRTRTKLTNMATSEIIRALAPGYTVHGFRSSFRDWAGETTDFPREVAEACLAHALRDKVEAAYRRGDALEKRRKLLEAWEAHCLSAPEHITLLGSCGGQVKPSKPPP